jgi:hypothetical protein
VASPVFKTGVTRQRRAGWVRFPHSPVLLVFGLLLVGSHTLRSQEADTVTVRAKTDSIRKGPILTSKQAFWSSFAFPGYAQFRLGRPNSGTMYALVEITSLALLGKAARDLREARRVGTDSVPTGYTVDPVTGAQVPTGYTHTRFNPERIRARRGHVEDWVVTILFNHLISGVDAFISANFWDFPQNTSVSTNAKSTNITITVPW